MRWTRWGLSLLLLAVIGGASGCASYRRDQDEIKMGSALRADFEKQIGPIYENQDVQTYLREIGSRISRHTGRLQFPWECRVIKSTQINAYALPGGYIYITAALLFRLEDEAQLAFILAHEMAHVAHGDSIANRKQDQSSGSDPVNIRYSLAQEENADLTGLQYLTAEGYDPDAAVQIEEILQIQTMGGQPVLFLQTHPRQANRIETLRERVKKELTSTISSGRAGRDSFERHVKRYLPEFR